MVYTCAHEVGIGRFILESDELGKSSSPTEAAAEEGKVFPALALRISRAPQKAVQRQKYNTFAKCTITGGPSPSPHQVQCHSGFEWLGRPMQRHLRTTEHEHVQTGCDCLVLAGRRSEHSLCAELFAFHKLCLDLVEARAETWLKCSGCTLRYRTLVFNRWVGIYTWISFWPQPGCRTTILFKP